MATLTRRLNQNGGCTQSTCPVSESLYGYRPNLAATVIFFILFTVSCLTYLIQGLHRRSRSRWFFTLVMVLGSLSELLGYVAKLLLRQNPFSNTGFQMSVVVLTFAPAFYAAGIYYTLRHICETFGVEQYSRLRPSLYTWLFISCDLFSILLQAVGGAVSSASTDFSVLHIGSAIMLAGLATQVFTLFVFGLLAVDVAVAISSHRRSGALNLATQSRSRFRFFLAALVVAYFCILIRCGYRVAELARGWTDNPILRDEAAFIGLDSVPCGIAAVVLNVWHPAWCFPRDDEMASEEMQEQKQMQMRKMEDAGESSADEAMQRV